MKLMVVGDVHFSTYSSILRGRGKKYSKRLENLIQSLNWVERIADEHETDAVIYLGDFFDKSELTAEELSALKEVMWNYQIHYFLCGNHEMGRYDHSMSSSHVFNLSPDFRVIDKPYVGAFDGRTVAFYPYALEENRVPLNPNAQLIFSHNDLQISYGAYQSKEGYTPEEIKAACKLFVNGHLHNHYKDLDNHYVNLGNLTGQNFSEDATKYKHYVMIIDTVDLTFELIENPHAYEFYKIDFTEDAVPFIDDPTRAVVTVKCYADQLDEVKRTYADCVESRILLTHLTGEAGEDEAVAQLETVDHLQQFRSYVETEVGNDELTLDELDKVLSL